MSTRWQRGDLLDLVARVACARRRRLLDIHRGRLSREDLEDCYSQATLELLTAVRRGRPFASEDHVANALDQRLVSRIRDRRRALRGRSPMEAALWCAARLGERHEDGDFSDVRADVHELACLRQELRRLCEMGPRLTVDQRLVLTSQVGGDGCARFCARHGWSTEKYRKVAQRARARLRA